ncbi:MAG: 16S rRNA (guanine(527)-N(7))-methyltransferase RsmG [Deltaproteobacteria bacterium]|nr:16S rRNA (guanine(527)-N(7))-methyltransferase RsmG [Deltaproteobacteria bacterium]
MTRTEAKQILKRGLEELDINGSEDVLEKFLVYLDELKKWNKKINLTSIEGDEEIIKRHFLDSLTPYPLIKEASSLLDIGSGGGFPGLPLKIVLPHLKVTLVDSVEKKVFFLKHAIRTLGLANIEALKLRAGDEESKDMFGSFDCVISRALTSLYDYYQIGHLYAKTAGTVIAMKGPLDKKLSEEIKIVPERNKFEVIESKTPLSSIKTTIIVFRPPLI